MAAAGTLDDSEWKLLLQLAADFFHGAAIAPLMGVSVMACAARSSRSTLTEGEELVGSDGNEYRDIAESPFTLAGEVTDAVRQAAARCGRFVV